MTLQLNELSDEFEMSSAPVGLVNIAARSGLYRNYVKRLFDVAAVLSASLVVGPLILLLALLVAADGSNPFYWNERVGRRGRNFRMLKLRTMVPDADKMLEDYLSRNAEARLEWNSTQKLKSDPRITRIGRFLRKTSLDELPQLWNVLTGDMSLVGPRPMMPSQRPLYHGLAYYSLRPGITGIWQVSDRNESAFSKRAEYDSAYDEKLTFRMDMWLLWSTVRVVLKGTGY
ncbi:lipopolysaccharide/colanic/teichoic acid biosynthesis glycosyltransferase [Defluviimonas denitrificans]|jgi:lipopolysaccharide/colanic/teichoic acid biosynthesis glycosyltransferase|uniref:Lipopolysaccharide/colanic/teichoic acid biosynthesis glycosyltransferase n=2 Tax=Albidovulum denitrificans TaxID=404881 RepID=A0A2S8S2Z1_9RHOB|nr:lipopolysaccharide/colanic/teichoic acid biosynthesis glycosyltransferase [Defluviimonas denitrificans]